jgi:hypothetical protein
MKKPSKNSKQQVHEFPVWTFEQAQRAVPYITSVVNSIREHFLNLQTAQIRAERLADTPGLPSREQIIEQDDTDRDIARHEQDLLETLQELTSLNIHCIEPIQGLAMIPFVQSDQLAWFVFDLFTDKKLEGWRFHHDDLYKRRPLADLTPEPVLSSVVT